MGSRIKFNSEEKLYCPRDDSVVCVKDCIYCDDIFGLDIASKRVLCNRGNLGWRAGNKPPERKE